MSLLLVLNCMPKPSTSLGFLFQTALFDLNQVGR